MEEARIAQRAEDAFDMETGLPRLPPGEPPFPEGVPGLPRYRKAADQYESDSDREGQEPCYEPAADPNEPKLVYSAPAEIKKVKKDKIDKKVDDFLKEIYKA